MDLTAERDANIGPQERRKRLLFGLVWWAIGLGTALALSAQGLSRWWRSPLFLCFWLGALGVFQAREKT